MKILVAPDKFKDSLTATQVCESIAKGLRQANKAFEIDLHPLADGGEQSIDILAKAIPMNRVVLVVTDPLGRPTQAHYYLDKTTAYIELAVASGLGLLAQKERNPMLTSTLGTGVLLVEAIKNGATVINLFVGGSATNDGGMGIAQAFGYRFLDADENVLAPIGKNLSNVKRIDNTKVEIDLSKIVINVLTDVKNLAAGDAGASLTYAKQKGATKEERLVLEEGMLNLVRLLERDYGTSLAQAPRLGAAGGIGVCLSTLLKANFKSGIAFLISKTGFEEKVKNCDWIISGEGRLDTQSLEGKVISEVAALAKKYKKPFMLMVGENRLKKAQITALGVGYLSEILQQAGSETLAKEQAAHFLEEIAFDLGTFNFGGMDLDP